jgi:hypothetical protein
MDVLMNDSTMEPFVFVIIPKREEKNYRKNHQDVVRCLSLSLSDMKKISCLKH